MRGLTITILSTALASCGSAKAEGPNINNPVHCIAALGSVAIELDRERNHPQQVKEIFARMAFESKHARDAGMTRDEVKAAMLEFNKANHFEPALMHRVAAQCGARQDADPSFAEHQRAFLAAMDGRLS
jgi:hypothetical protein